MLEVDVAVLDSIAVAGDDADVLFALVADLDRLVLGRPGATLHAHALPITAPLA